ncbi:unnamed protein product [Plutella xylostella]|uniref:(diamondback moth) hypothetical protein n=1 Tax=Plutella xylostella TaxID=51655 RepID=A0A8S4D5D6_PLUXY|nr:unnamed protein product [Plutella xylostella]
MLPPGCFTHTLSLLVSAMLPPGSSQHVSRRLLRLALLVAVDTFPDHTLMKIFTSITDWHFAKGFVESLVRQSKAVVSATIDVYRAVTESFLPTPSKCHYLFNLRDLSRVIKGVLLVPATHMKDLNKLVALWLHETYRCFCDRLVNDEDREKLFAIAYKAVYANFRVHLDAVLTDLGYLEAGETPAHAHAASIVFGNYMQPDADPKIYDLVQDIDDMAVKMEYYLGEYNAASCSPMRLVMFRCALDHVSRCARVLLQDNGACALTSCTTWDVPATERKPEDPRDFLSNLGRLLAFWRERGWLNR